MDRRGCWLQTRNRDRSYYIFAQMAPAYLKYFYVYAVQCNLKYLLY